MAHDAGGALAGDEGALRQELVATGDDQEVDVVDRRGVDLDEDFAGGRCRVGEGFVQGVIGAAVFVDDDGAHGQAPRW